MNTATLHQVTDYITEAFNFIAGREGFKGGIPYFDTATRAKATIGYGFNIEVTDYLLLVLKQLRIVDDTMETTVINARRDAFTTAINNTPDGKDPALIANLNQIANWYGVPTFSINRTQGETIFREIIEGTTTGGNTPIQIPGKQERLDGWLTEYNIDASSLHGTKEYIALTSLFYNRENVARTDSAGTIIRDAQGRRIPDRNSLIGLKLLAALEHDNRAEAWYEIRYNSNGGGSASLGIANRRYEEADLFGLYDNGTTAQNISDAESKEVLRMYTRHQIQETDTTKTIQYYETSYPPSSLIDAELLIAKNRLITTFALGATINNVFVGASAGNYLNDSPIDIIAGTDKNDLIFGEGGNDVINGMEGNDVIYGGEGSDHIYGGSGAGNDTIFGEAGDDITLAA